MIAKKFIEIQKVDPDFHEESRWFHRCRALGQPFITIKRQGARFSVEWDHISYHPDIDKDLLQAINANRHEFDGIYDLVIDKKTEYSFSRGVIFFSGLEHDGALMVAESLFNTISRLASALPISPQQTGV